MDGKMFIFSAPSGSGKTTIVKHVLHHFPNLKFSISATNRAPRGKEKDGEDYYFLETAAFQKKIAASEFLEWEEVYDGRYYGTLKSELKRIWDEGKHVVFDVDVVGGLNIKKQYPKKALAIFIQTPDLKELENRLRKRGTDSEQDIQQRLNKAGEEMAYAQHFDHIIINEQLEKAKEEAVFFVKKHLKNNT